MPRAYRLTRYTEARGSLRKNLARGTAILRTDHRPFRNSHSWHIRELRIVAVDSEKGLIMQKGREQPNNRAKGLIFGVGAAMFAVANGVQITILSLPRKKRKDTSHTDMFIIYVMITPSNLYVAVCTAAVCAWKAQT